MSFLRHLIGCTSLWQSLQPPRRDFDYKENTLWSLLTFERGHQYAILCAYRPKHGDMIDIEMIWLHQCLVECAYERAANSEEICLWSWCRPCYALRVFYTNTTFSSAYSTIQLRKMHRWIKPQSRYKDVICTDVCEALFTRPRRSYSLLSNCFFDFPYQWQSGLTNGNVKRNRHNIKWILITTFPCNNVSK